MFKNNRLQNKYKLCSVYVPHKARSRTLAQYPEVRCFRKQFKMAHHDVLINSIGFDKV